MTESDLQVNPIDLLAVEFVDRIRRGEEPRIGAWAERHPQFADEIRELFPTIASLERIRAVNDTDSSALSPTPGGVHLERLGDLRLIREIGRGGMGIVYEAEQESLRRQVAVKVLPRQSLLDPKHLRRFRREARTAAKLHHTNIVPVLGIGEHDGYHYYVMQKITGVSLEKILPLIGSGGSTETRTSHVMDAAAEQVGEVAIAAALTQGKLQADPGKATPSTSTPSFDSAADRLNTKQGAIRREATSLMVTGDFFDELNREAKPGPGHAVPDVTARTLAHGYWSSIATIGRQVASALGYAHQHGTMHRDIKPANLIIDLEGTVWVADFGLARAIEPDDVTGTGDIVGTLKYMAPEQMSGQADARSDVFSLGLTLYELAALRPAWDESDRRRQISGGSGSRRPPMLRTVNSAIPRDLETIIHKSIAMEPDERYQSAEELSADLQRFLEGRPVRARRSPAWERLWRWARRDPALAATSAAAAVLMCAVAVISLVGQIQVSKAYRDEAEQRRYAEDNAEIALSALDRIFERFTPDGLPVLFEENSSNPQIATPAVLSSEAADLLQELVIYYQELSDQRGDHVKYRERIALANRRLGDIYQSLGQIRQAQMAYDDSLEILTNLAAGTAPPAYLAEIAGLHIEIGNTWRQVRRLPEATNSWATAERILEGIAAQTGTDSVSGELARVYYLQIRRNSLAPGGAKGRAGRRSGRRAETDSTSRVKISSATTERKLNEALRIMEQLTDTRPDVPAFAHLLSLLYLEAASFHGRTDRSLAADYHQRSILVLESLTEDWPDNAEFQFSLCAAQSAGNPRDASRSHQYLDAFAERLTEAAANIQTLVESHPQIPRYRAFQAGIHHKLGTVLMQLNFSAESEQHYSRTIDNYGFLSKRFPEAAEYYDVKQALARQSLAGVLMLSDTKEQVTRARDELLAGIATLENAEAESSDREVINSRLRGCYRRLEACNQLLERFRNGSVTTGETTSG